MRIFEVLMVLFSIPAIAWTLITRRPWPLWIRFVAVLAVLLLPVHAVVEGAHWQMAPIYLALFVLTIALLRRRNRERAPIILCSLATLLILAGLALCYTLPMFQLPKTTGPYPIATTTLYFSDPNRKETHPHAPPMQRQVVVQLWYPSATSKGKHAVYREWGETDPRSTYQAVLRIQALQDAPVAAGRFPLVIFNHAWRGFRNRSTYILEELASQGFIVVAISHPWNSAIVQLQNGYIADGRDQVDLGDFYSRPPMTLEQRLNLSKSEMRIQTDDDKFVLDQLTLLDQSSTTGSSADKTPIPMAGHMDLTHVGSFGHSFGGSVSAELASEDSRVLSAILLDGVLSGPVAETGLPKPLFRIMAKPEPLPPGSENSPIPATQVRARMGQAGEHALTSSFDHFGGYQLIIGGIDHENFTDKGFFSPFHSLSGIGQIPQARVATIVNAYVVAFFRQTLTGQTQPLLKENPSPFPEVLSFQSWQGSQDATPSVHP